jgi:tetratricopeptide (TPR) repeat protein
MSSIRSELFRKAESSENAPAKVLSNTTKTLNVKNLYEHLSDDDDTDLNEKINRQGTQTLTPGTEITAKTSHASLKTRSFQLKKSVKKIAHGWTEVVAKADAAPKFDIDFPIPWKQVKKSDKQIHTPHQPSNDDCNSNAIEWSLPPDLKAKYEKHKQVVAARHRELGTKPLKRVSLTTVQIEKHYNQFLRGCLRELIEAYGTKTLIQQGIFELYQSFEIQKKETNRPSKSKAAEKNIAKLSQKCDQLYTLAKVEYNQFFKELINPKREAAAIKTEAAFKALIDHIKTSFDKDHTTAKPESLYILFEKLTARLEEAYFILACIYYENLLYQKALKCLKYLLAENPLHLKAIFLRGRIHFDLCEMTKAKKDFEFVINNDNQKSFLVNAYLTATKIRLHFFEQSTTPQLMQASINSYIKLLTCRKMATYHPKAALFLADLYFLKGNHSLAARILKKACKLDPRANLNPLVIKLKVMLCSFKLEAAVSGFNLQSFRAGTERKHLYFRAIYLSAKELVNLGYYNKALIYLNELIQLSPSIPVLCIRARVYIALNDKVSAKKDYLELLRLYNARTDSTSLRQLQPNV